MFRNTNKVGFCYAVPTQNKDYIEHIIQLDKSFVMSMKFPNDAAYPVLYDKRIMLRKVDENDLPDLVDISFYDGVQAVDVAMAAMMQAKIDLDILNGNSLHWCIIDRITGELLGTCGYYRGLDQGEGELGCVMRAQFRGKGYMSCALQLAIDYGWNGMGLHRIWAATTKDNLPAIKLLERLNFKLVAEMRDDEVEYECI